VCLILIKEIFRFKFIPEMFSLFQEMNDAKLYASCHGMQARDVSRVLSAYIKSMSWKTGDQVLDLGCGPGSVTTQVLMPRLPEDFGLLVGADLSANMIQYASEKYTHSKLRFTQFDLAKDIGNTSQLRPSGSDKIFSFYCLHWIHDHRYYLAIKPGFHS
jgi:juvenile hormone acid methyltransferase